jgi:hypothetical protein
MFVVIGLVFLQILLMSAAFVGGRMIGQQNQRTNGLAPNAQLPSQLPKDAAAGTGSVQKIQDTVITLSQGGGFGGPGGGPSGPPGQGGNTTSTTSQLEVTVSSETKYYKSTSSGGMPGMPSQTNTTSVQVSEATLSDVKVGNQLMVWGTKNGTRITAEVVYIQGQMFGP